MKKRLWVLLLLLAFFGLAQAAVDVNTATQSELETVRGIGPALSARIVEARKQGPFKDIEDLQQRVRGIGEASGRKLVQAGLVVGSPKATAGAGAAAKPGTTSKSDASPAAGASVTRTTVGKGVVSEVKPGPEKAADQGAPKAPAKAASSPAPGANPPPADPKK